MDVPWDSEFESIIRQVLPFLDDTQPLTPDLNTASVGLDSVGAVELLGLIEVEYNLVVPDELLELKNFATPGIVWDMVASLRPGGSKSSAENTATPLPTPVTGVGLFPDRFEQMVMEIRNALDKLAEGESFIGLSGSPVIAREVIEQAGYVAGFPQLLGTVHSFVGDDTAWRGLRKYATPHGEWHGQQQITDVVLTPAACYHVFAHLAGGRVDDPLRFRVEAPCYRHEATSEPGRFRSFRMREFVFLGGAEECVAWRERWLQAASSGLHALGLDVRTEPANDPFFGHDARLLRRHQLQQQLKWELTVPTEDGSRQAVASSNYHLDHFGQAFGIHTTDGQPVHSACTAFGLERLTLALQRAD